MDFTAQEWREIWQIAIGIVFGLSVFAVIVVIYGAVMVFTKKTGRLIVNIIDKLSSYMPGRRL